MASIAVVQTLARKKVSGQTSISIDAKGRPESVTSKLVKHAVGGVKDAPAPIAYLNSLQDPTRNQSGYERGHIVAESLGGPNISENIVPLNAHMNRAGDWRVMELAIGKLKKEVAGFIAVRINYGDDTGIPRSFLIRVSATQMPAPSEADGPQVDDAGPRIDRTQGWRCWRVVNAMQPRTPLADSVTLEYWPLFEKHWEEFEGLEEDDLAQLPQPLSEYSFLDFINDEKQKLSSVGDFGVATKFNDVQRKAILAFNAFNHRSKSGDGKGWLYSDDSSDVHQDLSTKGCRDAPHVDHIRPRSKGGNNAFCNARVVSEAHNVSKSAKYEYTDLDKASFRRTSRAPVKRQPTFAEMSVKHQQDDKNARAKRKADAVTQKRMN